MRPCHTSVVCGTCGELVSRVLSSARGVSLVSSELATAAASAADGTNRHDSDHARRRARSFGASPSG